MGRPTERRPAAATAAGVEVSVVLPAYNEARTIENTVRVTVETLESFLPADASESSWPKTAATTRRRR